MTNSQKDRPGNQRVVRYWWSGTYYACAKFPRCSTEPLQLPSHQVREGRFPRCYDHDLPMDVPGDGR